MFLTRLEMIYFRLYSSWQPGSEALREQNIVSFNSPLKEELGPDVAEG